MLSCASVKLLLLFLWPAQVIVELYKLALPEGMLVLRGMNLNAKPFKLPPPDPEKEQQQQQPRLPKEGILTFRAVAIKPSYYGDAPLSDEDFKSRCVC